MLRTLTIVAPEVDNRDFRGTRGGNNLPDWLVAKPTVVHGKGTLGHA